LIQIATSGAEPDPAIAAGARNTASNAMAWLMKRAPSSVRVTPDEPTPQFSGTTNRFAIWKNSEINSEFSQNRGPGAQSARAVSTAYGEIP